jgi:hypothetical protein
MKYSLHDEPVLPGRYPGQDSGYVDFCFLPAGNKHYLEVLPRQHASE